jgi:hypothetical protein
VRASTDLHTDAVMSVVVLSLSGVIFCSLFCIMMHEYTFNGTLPGYDVSSCHSIEMVRPPLLMRVVGSPIVF